jgi:hypothetical protein
MGYAEFYQAAMKGFDGGAVFFPDEMKKPLPTKKQQL